MTMLWLKPEVSAKQVAYKCCMYMCSHGPANPGHLVICGSACSFHPSSGCCVKVLGCAVRGKGGGGGSVATAIGDLADITCSSLMSDPASKKMLSTCEFDDWHHTHAVWPEHTAQACRMIAI